MGKTPPTVEEARSRVFDDWPEMLFNSGGAPRSVFAPSDGSAASPELADANRALREWRDLAAQIWHDARTLAVEVDRLRACAP